MNKKIHSSWLICFVSCGVLIGVILSVFTLDIFSNFSWLILSICLAVISFINKKKYIIFLALFAGLFLGLFRGSNVYVSQSLYKPYIGSQVVVSGKVAEDTSLGSGGDQRIKLKDIRISNQKLPGSIWISSNVVKDIKRSDELTIKGFLTEGFGSFCASMYRVEIIRITKIKNSDPALVIRDDFSKVVRKGINDPEAGLGLGFLTGQHSSLPENLNNNLRLLGLTHIVVASGYNLTILVRLMRRLLARISKYLAAFGSVCLISGFVLVTGLSPSMSRAGLISLLSLAAWYYGRRINPFILLPFSAAITAIWNPFFMWGDLGWYLSFAAFGGVMILSPLILDYFWGDKKPGQLHQIFLETTSAQIMTLPIIASAFNQYSPLALIANLFVLPLIPATMLLTFLSGAITYAIPSLAVFVGIPASFLLGVIIKVVDWLAALPIAGGEIKIISSVLVLIYTFILIAAIYMWRRTKHNFNKDSIIE